MAYTAHRANIYLFMVTTLLSARVAKQPPWVSFLQPHLMQRLHALFLFLVCWGTTCASDASFLKDALVRKDQVQHVLEHEPAQSPSCQNTVRLTRLSLAAADLSAHCSTLAPSRLHYATMRLSRALIICYIINSMSLFKPHSLNTSGYVGQPVRAS